MSNAPADLLGLRAGMSQATGITDPNQLGIVGNGAHQRTGGYHEGRDVLTANGMFHPPATSHVGASTEDYSCRMLRDRTGLTNSSSAFDLGNNWPKGGNAAWLRYNNALVARLKAGDPSLSAIRAINYSPDGATRYRIDRQNGWKQEATTDTVTVHTHHEFYRDTEGGRQATLNALVALAQAAIANQPATPAHPSGEEDMGMIAMAGDGRMFHCIGGFSHYLATAQDVLNTRHLASQGAYQLATGPATQTGKPGEEWTDNGQTRMGWYPGGAFGPEWVPAAASLTDEQVAQLGTQLSAAVHAGASVEDIRTLLNSAHLATP